MKTKTKIIITIVILLGFTFYFRNEIKIGAIEIADSYKRLFEKEEVVLVSIKNEVPAELKKEASIFLTPEEETVAATKVQSPEEEELETVGYALSKIPFGCSRPYYEGKRMTVAIVIVGCGKQFWPSVEQAAADRVLLEVRQAVKNFLANEKCEEGYVKNYLVELSKTPEKFQQDAFKEALSCAGEITFQKMQPAIE
jgi:hypothetical protein